MKKILLVFSVGLLGLNFLFGQTPEIDKLNQKIDRFFPQNPDSSLVYNRQLLNYSHQLSDSTVAETYKKLGLNFGQTEQADSANYYFHKSLAMANRQPLLKGNIYVKWGKVERDFGNFKKGHRILDTAETLFKNQDNRSGLGKVLIERGTIDHYNRQSGKAIKELNKAVGIFRELDDTENLLIAKQELAGAFLMESDYRFAKNLFGEVLSALKDEKENIYYYVLVNQGDCFFELGEIEKAQENYQIAQTYFEKHQFRKYDYFVSGKIARTNRALENFKKARSNFKKAYRGLAGLKSRRLKYVTYYYLDFLKSIGDKENALKIARSIQKIDRTHKISLNLNNDLQFLKQVQKAFKMNGLYRQALQTSERINILKDSVNAAKNEEITKEVSAKYKNKYQRKRNKDLLSKNEILADNIKKNKTINWLLIVLVVLLLIISGFVYNYYRKKAKKRGLQIKEYKAHKKQLEQKHLESKRLSEEIKQKLEKKERQVIATSMRLSDGESQVKEILQKASTKEVKPNVHKKIMAVLNQTNYWQYFKQRFVEVHPEFIRKIEEQFPELTSKEVDFCMLLKLNLENKEIARLLGIRPESVITKKYRIRKKLTEEEESLLKGILAA